MVGDDYMFKNLFSKNVNKKSNVTLSWNIEETMIKNIKFSEEYDKNISLKHFMLKIGYSNLEINNYLKYPNPFIKVKNDVKKYSEEDKLLSNLFRANIEKGTNFIKVLLIENPDDDYLETLIIQCINIMMLEIAEYVGLNKRTNRIENNYSYSEMIQRLMQGNIICDEDIIMCLCIVIKRIGDINLFISKYSNYKKLYYYNSEYKSFQKAIGENYVDGIFYKIIENSLKCASQYSYAKLFYKNDISKINDYNIYNITFKEEQNNEKYFLNHFEVFTNDFNMIKNIIYNADSIYESNFSKEEIENLDLNNKDNYDIMFEQLTSGGRKKKYPLVISYEYSKSNFRINASYSYNNKSILDRIDIIMLKGNIERVIICKRNEEKLEIFEIKEHDICIDAFPKVIYKK